MWRVHLTLFVAMGLLVGADKLSFDVALAAGLPAMIVVAVFQVWHRRQARRMRTTARQRALVAAFRDGPPAPPARVETRKP